jgi:hypothetical protein
MLFLGIASLLLLLVQGGCKTSTRTISVQGTILETCPTHFIESTWLGLVGSSNGLYYTKSAFVDERHGRIDICEYRGHRVIRSFSVDENGPIPVMFDRNAENLYAISSTGGESANSQSKRREETLLKINIATGEKTSLQSWSDEKGNLILGAKNYNHSIVGDSGLLMTRNGVVHSISSEATFDTYGNAWFKEAGRWVKLTPDGVKTFETKPPEGRVKDQTHQRGSMRLVEQQTTLKHKGAEAYVSTIWLEHGRAKGNDSAVVESCLDMRAFGFVPGRKEIYLVTDQGVDLVEYKAKDK